MRCEKEMGDGTWGKIFYERPKYFENLHNLINLVIKWDLGSGGCCDVSESVVFFL